MRISKRHLSLLTVLLSGVLLLSAAGCGSSNPNISAAQDNLESGNYQQALSSIETEISTHPQNAQAYLLKGNILLQQLQTAQNPERGIEMTREMRSAYDQAVELDPSLQSDVNNRLLLAYQQTFQKGVNTYNQAQQQQSEEVYNQAAAILGSAAAMRPDSSTAPLYEAFAYVNSQQGERATAPLQHAIEAGADSVSNYVLLSQLYAQQQKSDSAIAVLENASEAHPDDSTVQSELLNAYVRSGQTERAMTAYEEAIAREPENATYRYNYGSMLLNNDRYDEAVEQLEQAVEMAPDNASAQFNLGAAYLNKGVDLNERVVELDSTMSAQQDEMSQQESSEMQQQMQDLAQQRSELFQQAIPPMERARELVNSGQSDASINEQSICQALYQAYAQTNQNEKAQNVASCAGFDE